MDVLDRGDEVILVADDPRCEAVAEEVSLASVAQVESLRIATVDAMYPR